MPCMQQMPGDVRSNISAIQVSIHLHYKLMLLTFFLADVKSIPIVRGIFTLNSSNRV